MKNRVISLLVLVPALTLAMGSVQAQEKKAAKPAAAARKANAAPAVATKAPTRRTPAQVVSMKDWVSRNLPGIEPPLAPAPRGKSGRK